MNQKISSLLGQIRLLENEVVAETQKTETAFCQQAHAQSVPFTAAVQAQHRQLRQDSSHYLLHSRFLVLLTAPVIWLCLIPMVLADIVGTFYQAVCFPIYGIPKVRRRDYLAFDRHRLTYLNFIEKVNCDYCAYVNGILAYFTEIAARTEQHWCPIKHAGCAKCAHSRYKKFLPFGDANQYRQHVEEVRRAYEDIESTDATAKKSAVAPR